MLEFRGRWGDSDTHIEGSKMEKVKPCANRWRGVDVSFAGNIIARGNSSAQKSSRSGRLVKSFS